MPSHPQPRHRPGEPVAPNDLGNVTERGIMLSFADETEAWLVSEAYRGSTPLQDPEDGMWCFVPGTQDPAAGARKWWSQLALIQIHGDDIET
jgi:hypothetical protein